MSSGWVGNLDQGERQALTEAEVPRWTEPMLATLTHDYFSDPEWLFERKLDGERCLAFRDGDELRLLSRNRKALNDTYPELAEALADQPCRGFVADGEIVAFDGDVTSFSRLQKRIAIKDPDQARASGVAVYLYLFDLLHRDGYDVTGLPLRRRKALLKDTIEFSERLRYTAHRNRDGERFREEACRKGWEGVIAKQAGAPYQHGRSRRWLKFKCGNRQELVVGGFTDPEGARQGFGALLLGYYEGEALRYAGRVGTGFDQRQLGELRKRLDTLERDHSPFADFDGGGKAVHWTRPELVAEVGFTEWTGDGRLRHPRFLGLRRDKAPREVVREGAEGS